jgi:AbrB family looped-hinge helix DNA binding protein
MYNLYKMLYMIGKFELYGVGKIGPKGQVVIPAEAREELGFRPGDKVMITGLPHGGGSVVVMNEKAFNKHLKHMQRHYEAMGRVLRKRDEFKEKKSND